MITENLAKTSLKIGAIKLRPNNPFLWASGYKMPIYNDNRMLLGDYDHRMLVANSLKKIVEKNNISFDYVAGIPTAGIAPAATLADLLEKPLIMFDECSFINLDYSISRFIEARDADVIASTCPYAIPAGVCAANNSRKPFIYVRESKKSHGLERKIEGIINKGDKTLIIDLFIDENKSYLVSAMDSVYEATGKQVKFNRWGLYKDNIDVSGKKLLVVEDLISTGSSSIKEVIEYRKHGAVVEQILSIFNYGLPEVNKNFENESIKVYSSLYYDTLISVAKENNYIDAEQEKLLADWRLDPFNWGEKNGFPKFVKN